MRNFALLVALISAAPLTWSEPAWAERVEFWVSAGYTVIPKGGIGSFLPAGTQDDIGLRGGFRFALRYALSGEGHLGHEVHYAFSRATTYSNLEDIVAANPNMNIHTGAYNFLAYFTSFENRIRPFGTVGLQFCDYVPPGGHPVFDGSVRYGVNYGLGIKFYVTDHLALRLDARQFGTARPFNLNVREGWLFHNELSSGIGFVF